MGAGATSLYLVDFKLSYRGKAGLRSALILYTLKIKWIAWQQSTNPVLNDFDIAQVDIIKMKLWWFSLPNVITRSSLRFRQPTLHKLNTLQQIV